MVAIRKCYLFVTKGNITRILTVIMLMNTAKNGENKF